MNSSQNGFILLKKWFIEKLFNAIRCVSLWAYFLFAVLFLGCMGIWIAFGHLYNSNFLIRDELLLAILSSAWAISGASCADFVFGEKENYIRSIALIAAVFLAIISFISLISAFGLNYFFAILSFILAGILWFIANSDKLKDVTDSSVSMGGNTSKNPTGNSGEFKV